VAVETELEQDLPRVAGDRMSSRSRCRHCASVKRIFRCWSNILSTNSRGARASRFHHIPDEVMERLTTREWPGNIREPRNFIERAAIVTTGRGLRPLVRGFSEPEVGAAPVRTMADAERAHITATLRQTNWVVGGLNGAASRLGLPRTSLISRMRRPGISREAFGAQGCPMPDAGLPESSGSSNGGFHDEFFSPRFKDRAAASGVEHSGLARAASF
jgi:regulatory Fis family protein